MGIDAFRYDGKRALVIGAATGMGAATAKLVADLGGEGRRKRLSLKAVDRRHAGLPADQLAPDRLEIVPERRDPTHARDHDASAHGLSPFDDGFLRISATFCPPWLVWLTSTCSSVASRAGQAAASAASIS